MHARTKRLERGESFREGVGFAAKLGRAIGQRGNSCKRKSHAAFQELPARWVKGRARILFWHNRKRFIRAAFSCQYRREQRKKTRGLWSPLLCCPALVKKELPAKPQPKFDRAAPAIEIELTEEERRVHVDIAGAQGVRVVLVDCSVVRRKSNAEVAMVERVKGLETQL